MRRACFWTVLGIITVATIWRGVAGRLQAADLARANRSAPANRAAMTTAEWRYLTSQASHWRQIMLKR